MYKKYNPFMMLGGLILLQCSIVFCLSLSRLYTLHSSFDSAVFNQVMWALLHSGIPTTTAAPPFTPLNWFGWHFTPIIAVMLPFYALWPQLELLQLIQCLLFANTALPIFLSCRRLTLSPNSCLIIALVYLTNLCVWQATIWDFHEISFACFIIAWLYWALLARRKAWFIALCIAVLLCKEHYGLVVFGFGILWWRQYKDGWFGPLVALTGVVAMALILTQIMPTLLGHPHPMVGGTETGAGGDSTTRYHWLGAPLLQSIPFGWALLVENGINSGAIYLLMMLGMLAFLPLLMPFTLLPGIADLAVNLLSANPMPRSLGSYHSGALMPVLVMAAAMGLARMCQKTRRLCLILMVFCNTILWLPLPDYWPWNLWQITEITWKKPVEIADIMRLSASKPFAVQSNMGAFFAGREEIYSFPNGRERAEIMAFHLQTNGNNPFNAYFVLSPQQHFAAIGRLLDNTSYGIVYWQNNWLVLQKNSPDQIDRKRVRSRLEALRVGLK